MRLTVVLGDVVASRDLASPVAFQRTLRRGCDLANGRFAEDLFAPFKILKGCDEIGGAVESPARLYGILGSISDHIYPARMRFAVVSGEVSAGDDARDTSLMDGPAFHDAAKIMQRLKSTGRTAHLLLGDADMDPLLTAQVNLLFALKEQWSLQQRRIVAVYDRLRRQNAVAAELRISQQAVSKTLRRCLWNEVHAVEEQLEAALQRMPSGKSRARRPPCR
jgi:hypothetical protein